MEPGAQPRAWPWPPGAATGVGSLPGTDIVAALRTVLDELPDLPFLPELPQRGPGADMIGRAAGLLVDFPVELYAARWKVTSRPGRDARTTQDLLERDLDALTEVAAGYTGAFKVQAAGPWTLAASLDLPIGGRLLRDAGAVRDLAASLAEGLRGYTAQIGARLPGARIVLQLDEPSLPQVLAGRVPVESGFGTLHPVEAATAQAALAGIVSATGVPVVVHCCAPGVPLDVLRRAGAAGVSLDLALVEDLDALGEALDAGIGLFAGAVDAGSTPSSAEVASRVLETWRKLGFALAGLPDQVVVTPSCGLPDQTPEQARAVLAVCRDAARRLRDEA